MTLTVPALPPNFIRLRSPPISNMSNDRSSIPGPREYPESKPAEALVEDPDAATTPDQINLPAPQEAGDVEHEVESPTPQARLTTQNLEKQQEEIGSAVEDFPFPHPENPNQRLFQAWQYLIFDESDFLGVVATRLEEIREMLQELVERKQVFNQNGYNQL